MPKRPESLETLQIALELVRGIPKGRTITALFDLAYANGRSGRGLAGEQSS